MKRVFVTSGILLAVLAAMLSGATVFAGPAQAAGAMPSCTTCGSGGNGNGGYAVQASVHFTGDAAPGGGSTVSIGVPATCWWSGLSEPAIGSSPAVSSTDPSTWLAWYDWSLTNTNGTFAPARVTLGERSMWEAAVARAQSGEKIQAYSASCRPDAPECAMNKYVGGSVMQAPPGWGNCGLSVQYNFFPVGAPPAPAVDPSDLAAIARDHMVIPEPQVERNPKVGTLGGATLVGLPTWFWVTNPASVGGAGGTRTIRAQVGAVWAQVVATTGGLVITSPAGGASCPPAVAAKPYSAGAADSSGCTVKFGAASVGYPHGYPVDATTTWEATWTGSDGKGGPLTGLTRGAQVAVPVAESQAVVTGR